MLTAVAVMLMAVVMATGAFAATNSVVLTPPASSDITATGGVTVTATQYNESAAVPVSGKTGADVVKTTGVSLPSGVSADKLVVAGAFDLSNASGTTIPAGGVTVTVKVAGAAQGDTYVMLHLNGQKWEVVGSGTVGAGGAVSGTFTNFSPVIVLTQAKTTTPSTSNSSSSEDDDDDSSSTTVTQTTTVVTVLAPQTGVNSAESMAVAVAVAGVAVAAFAAKKIKE